MELFEEKADQKFFAQLFFVDKEMQTEETEIGV
jgi:hypothetical protein